MDNVSICVGRSSLGAATRGREHHLEICHRHIAEFPLPYRAAVNGGGRALLCSSSRMGLLQLRSTLTGKGLHYGKHCLSPLDIKLILKERKRISLIWYEKALKVCIDHLRSHLPTECPPLPQALTLDILSTGPGGTEAVTEPGSEYSPLS